MQYNLDNTLRLLAAHWCQHTPHALTSATKTWTMDDTYVHFYDLSTVQQHPTSTAAAVFLQNNPAFHRCLHLAWSLHPRRLKTRSSSNTRHSATLIPWTPTPIPAHVLCIPHSLIHQLGPMMNTIAFSEWDAQRKHMTRTSTSWILCGVFTQSMTSMQNANTCLGHRSVINFKLVTRVKRPTVTRPFHN